MIYPGRRGLQSPSQLVPEARLNYAMRGWPRLDLNDPVNAGLSGYWSMDGGTISGTMLTDLSGNGNNGTLVSGPTLVLGPFGQALNFNGTSYGYALGPPNTVTSTQCAWVRLTAALPSWAFYVLTTFANAITGAGSYDKSLQFNFSASGVFAQYFIYDGSVKTATGTTDFSDFRWHHIAGVNDGTNVLIYIDGALQATTPAGNAASGYGNILLMAGTTAGYTQSPYAAMRDLRVYPLPLAANVIRKIATDTSGNLGLIVPTRRIVGGSAPPPSTTFSPVIGGGIGGAPGWIL